MNILEDIVERYDGEEFMVADGFDEAIIGVDVNSMRLIYSVSKCIEILMSPDLGGCSNMTEDEAIEYFNFNVSGAYVGEKTPIWCNDF